MREWAEAERAAVEAWCAEQRQIVTKEKRAVLKQVGRRLFPYLKSHVSELILHDVRLSTVCPPFFFLLHNFAVTSIRCTLQNAFHFIIVDVMELETVRGYT